MRFRGLSLVLLCAIYIVVSSLPAAAQDTTARDPHDLAKRLLGVTTPYDIPDPTPVYKPGATLAFWVNKKDHEAPTQITAVLAGASDNIYLWVEQGLTYDAGQMKQMAAGLGQLLAQMLSTGYLGHLQGLDTQLTLPDVDNDPHLYILFVSDLNDGRDSYYNAMNSVPADYTPGKYSNQHEIVFVNISKYPTVEFTNGLYYYLLAQAFYQLIANSHTPDQALWLKQALSIYFANSVQIAPSITDMINAYLQAPETAFTQVAPSTATAALGGQQLFLLYLQQRLGSTVFQSLFRQPGEGLAAIDGLLAQSGLSDPNTGQPLTARDLFADFIVSNVTNLPFGDGRYAYSTQTLPQNTVAQVGSGVRDLSSVNQLVGTNGQLLNQFGAYYLYAGTTKTVNFTLDFRGASTTAHLPLPADTPRFNHFYWSGHGRDRDTTLTRTFDLRGVRKATLTFDTWFDLADEWNYAYVEVSADSGATWKIVPTTNTTSANSNGLAYGVGFTGVSNTQAPRPAPFLGIVFDANGAITQIVPEGPVAKTEIRLGDVIVGHDGKAWTSGEDIFSLLGEHEAGDTIKLYIQRGSQRFDVPIVLGAHPTRKILPQPIWFSQSADLSPFAGQQILLRFEYISLPDQDNSGIVIDNIAIPEINFLDDAEDEQTDWTLDGWQHIDNDLPQRYLVETTLIDPQTSTVHNRQLIGPKDDATAGQWRFSLPANGQFIVSVSGLNDNTIMPAAFQLAIGKDQSQSSGG
jgi:hypothetical protein